MSSWCLDSSTALHALLPTGDCRAAEWLERATGSGSIYSSTLLELEIVRVLRRERPSPENAREVLDRVTLISIDDAILREAAAIESRIRASGAKHLAARVLLGNRAELVSSDAQMLAVANELGMGALNPLGKSIQTSD